MAYYDSLGKLLDGGYKFSEIWSGNSALNTPLAGSTYGFKIGDIVLYLSAYTYGRVNTTTTQGVFIARSSDLHLNGTKCILSSFKSGHDKAFSSSAGWTNVVNGAYYIYIGYVLEATITLSGSQTAGSVGSKLYKIGKIDLLYPVLL